jgi:hypothetical protein
VEPAPSILAIGQHTDSSVPLQLQHLQNRLVLTDAKFLIGQSPFGVPLPRLEQVGRAQEAADMIGAIHARSALNVSHSGAFPLKEPDAIMIELNQRKIESP